MDNMDQVRCSLASAVAYHSVMLRATMAVTLTQQRVPDVLGEIEDREQKSKAKDTEQCEESGPRARGNRPLHSDLHDIARMFST